MSRLSIRMTHWYKHVRRDCPPRGASGRRSSFQSESEAYHRITHCRSTPNAVSHQSNWPYTEPQNAVQLLHPTHSQSFAPHNEFSTFSGTGASVNQYLPFSTPTPDMYWSRQLHMSHDSMSAGSTNHRHHAGRHQELDKRMKYAGSSSRSARSDTSRDQSRVHSERGRSGTRTSRASTPRERNQSPLDVVENVNAAARSRDSPQRGACHSVNKQEYSTSATESAMATISGDIQQGNGADPLLSRKWDFTNFGRWYSNQGHSEDVCTFTIASYNLLAQNLLEDNQHLYADCDRRVLEWDFRKWNLLKEMEAMHADVFCLQEVQAEHFEAFYKPEMKKLGFIGVFVKRTGDKIDGCATFVRRDKFHLVSSHPVHYYKEGCPTLDRDNVGLVVVVKPKTHGRQREQKICIGNTHLLFNPKRGDVKLLQMALLLAELDKHAFCGFKRGRIEYCPVLLCGDLNMEPYSLLYKMITKGHFEFDEVDAMIISGQQGHVRRSRPRMLDKSFISPNCGISQYCQYLDIIKRRYASMDEKLLQDYQATDSGTISHGMNLKSVYTHRKWQGSSKVPEITTHHGRASSTVDYLFHNGNEVHGKTCLPNKNLSLLAKYSLLSTRDLKQVRSLPNDAVSSDHLMLAAKFCLKVS